MSVGTRVDVSILPASAMMMVQVVLPFWQAPEFGGICGAGLALICAGAHRARKTDRSLMEIIVNKNYKEYMHKMQRDEVEFESGHRDVLKIKFRRICVLSIWMSLFDHQSLQIVNSNSYVKYPHEHMICVIASRNMH